MAVVLMSFIKEGKNKLWFMGERFLDSFDIRLEKNLREYSNRFP